MPADTRAITCNTDRCKSKFRPAGSRPVAEQLRAAGWRHFDGETQGGKKLADVRCPACSKPDPVTVQMCEALAREVR